MKRQPTSDRSVKEPKLSRTHPPADLAPADWQRALRRQFGRDQAFVLENRGNQPLSRSFASAIHVESQNLQQVNLVVQDWGGLLGLTLPTAAPGRYRGLLVMNTYLATAEKPLPDGFVQWRSMCRTKPDFAISRLFSRGNPQMSEAECAAYDAPFRTGLGEVAPRSWTGIRDS